MPYSGLEKRSLTHALRWRRRKTKTRRRSPVPGQGRHLSALVCTKWLSHPLTSKMKPRLPMNSLEHPIAVNDAQYSLTVRDHIRNQPNIACQTTKALVCSTRRCQISANLMPYRHAESTRQCSSGRKLHMYNICGTPTEFSYVKGNYGFTGMKSTFQKVFTRSSTLLAL